MDRFTQDIDKLREASNLRILPDSMSSQMLNLSSNDYLGLNDDATLWNEFIETHKISTHSMSSCSSRLLTGNHSEYQHLEHSLGVLFGCDKKALVFPSGYHVNVGILPAISTKGTLIIADKLVHASIIDGLRLSAATVERYNHNDMNHLRRILEKYRADFSDCIIVTESIFSMDGDIADLQSIVDLKKEFDTMLYVDEAHAFGVRGNRGEGVLGEMGLLNEADIIVATFGKACASMGAFCMTSEILRSYLVNFCRSMIFTTGLPPINVAWSRFIVDKLPQMESLRRHLSEISEKFSQTLDIQTDSHIVPYIVGSNEATVALAAELRQRGFYVLPIRYPTVPKGKARLRLSLKASMQIEELENVASAILELKKSI